MYAGPEGFSLKPEVKGGIGGSIETWKNLC